MIHSAADTPSVSEPVPMEKPYLPMIAGVAFFGEDAHREIAGTSWALAWNAAGLPKSKSHVVRIATAPSLMSCVAADAAIVLSDFVSIHFASSLRPFTPPALLISSRRSRNALP